MAYDAHDGYVVEFGGVTAAATDLGQTWIFSAGKWTSLNPPIPPAARQGECLAYDPALSSIVLFGGLARGIGTFVDDTWEFQGGIWTNVTSSIAGAPPPGSWPAAPTAPRIPG